MMRACVLAFVSALALLASPSATAQRAVDTLFGDIAGLSFGVDVANVGDVNGDGSEDFIIGLVTTFKSPNPQRGRARVHSGSDRTLLFEVISEQPVDGFGERVAGVGDLNGDGTPDFAVAAPKMNGAFQYGGMVRAFSGVDASVLWTRYGERDHESLGLGLDSVGDVNRDGHCDILVGGPPSASLNLLGVARVYSGADGSTLHEVWGDSLDDRFGKDVAGIGDCDGDGLPDFAIAAPYPAQPSFSYIHVYSGATASRLLTIPPITDRISGVSSVGDIDADGRNDIAVAEILGLSLNGGVFVYSGADASTLLSVPDFQREALGSALAAVGDVDNDGVPDLLVGASASPVPFNGAGVVRVISGASGETTFEVNGDYASDQIGFALASIKTRGNQLGETVSILIPSLSGNRVRIHLYNTPVADSYCTSMVNSTNRPSKILISSGTNSISANTLVFRATYVPPGQSGLFIYSPDQAQTPLGDGVLCLESSTQGFINRLPAEQSNPQGHMEHTLDLASPPAPQSMITAGSTWHFQAFFRDLPAGMAGFNFSDAITVTFVP